MSHLVPRRELRARESGAGLTRVPPGAGARIRMSAGLRAALFTSFGLLWLSGAVWLGVHFALEQPTPFGPLPNPWEPVLLKVHGLLAAAAVFLLGWVTADHLSVRRREGRKHRSGLVLAGTAALLALSGYALYYTTGMVHEVAAGAHECLGVGSIAAALAHWWRNRPPR
jgi:hypothetical protein